MPQGSNPEHQASLARRTLAASAALFSTVGAYAGLSVFNPNRASAAVSGVTDSLSCPPNHNNMINVFVANNTQAVGNPHTISGDVKEFDTNGTTLLSDTPYGPVNPATTGEVSYNPITTEDHIFHVFVTGEGEVTDSKTGLKADCIPNATTTTTTRPTTTTTRATTTTTLRPTTTSSTSTSTTSTSSSSTTSTTRPNSTTSTSTTTIFTVPPTTTTERGTTTSTTLGQETTTTKPKVVSVTPTTLSRIQPVSPALSGESVNRQHGNTLALTGGSDRLRNLGFALVLGASTGLIIDRRLKKKQLEAKDLRLFK